MIKNKKKTLKVTFELRSVCYFVFVLTVAKLLRRSAMPSKATKIMLDKPRANHVDLIVDMAQYSNSYICEKCRQTFKVSY